MLNDFIFCPYSIYLHNVYMDTDENVYHAKPQVAGRNAHENIDQKTTNSARRIIESLPVISHELRINGKIDIYYPEQKNLVERKLNLKRIFQGQIYQLWAQYFCMTEMGFAVNSIAFYEMSTHKSTPLTLPTAKDKDELIAFIAQFRSFSPRDFKSQNPNKCSHCIYCSLCDKTSADNVYT